MARGRMLNRSIAVSEKMDALGSDSVRLLATWIIPWLDKRGVFHADARIVRATVFPLRDDLSNAQVGAMLDQMAACKVIRRFEADGRMWMFWPGFAHNQKGLHAEREATEFPCPPEELQQFPEEVRQPLELSGKSGPEVQLQLQVQQEVEVQVQHNKKAAAPPNLDEVARAAKIDRDPSPRSKSARAAAKTREAAKYDLGGLDGEPAILTYLAAFGSHVRLPREAAEKIVVDVGVYPADRNDAAWAETCREWAVGNPVTGKTWNPLSIDRMLDLYRAKCAQTRARAGANGHGPSKAEQALALLKERSRA